MNPEVVVASERPPVGERLDRLCIDAIRTLTMDAVEKAQSGHPGMPMAMAPTAYLLYTRYLRHNPSDPGWPDRDRFVLSAGHGSMLLYSVLHLCGYDVSLDEIKRFRQWGSLTPGHPERILGGHETPGVETTTGPLGQGFANGVGMAMAERFLRERYGAEVMDHRVFAICSDGDLMEGVASEAASLAGHLGLGRIVYVYDDNHISIDGDTALSFDTEDVGARFRSYGWHVQAVEDATDLVAVSRALETAIAEEERPSLIRVRSTIAWPAPNARGTAAAHGAPLGEEEVRATKEALGWDPGLDFHVPDAVYDAFRSYVARGQALQREWERRLDRWRGEDPTRAAEWERAWEGRPAEGLGEALPTFDPAETGALATRAAGSRVMQAFAPYVMLKADVTANDDVALSTGSGDLSIAPKPRLPGAVLLFRRGRIIPELRFIGAARRKMTGARALLSKCRSSYCPCHRGRIIPSRIPVEEPAHDQCFHRILLQSLACGHRSRDFRRDRKGTRSPTA